MLLSKYYKTFDSTNPLSEYPRPNLKRDSYINLNGTWDFMISKSEEIPEKYDGFITVPYCVESVLSGINKKVNKDDILYYHKTITLDKSFNNDLILLHIDASDQQTTIYVNNRIVATSENGYFPIICNIKPFLKKLNNEIVIKVKDKLDHDYPFGKQRNDRKGMWYTPVSGIWQSIWLEAVSEDYIKNVNIKTDIDNKNIIFNIDSICEEFTITILEGSKVIYTNGKAKKNEIVQLDNLIYWDIDNPFLYDVIIKSKNDEIKTYFAYRKFSIDKKFFYLNNKKIFINGLLDQGYYPDGIYTPASYKAYEDDISLMKGLGFNTLRKHIKVEPLMYYYLADKLGMLIFQDVVNNGNYSFFVDTLLPTLGFKNNKVNNLKKLSNKQKEIYEDNLNKTIDYFNDLSGVCYLTLFNEGWGQHDVKKFYELAKNKTDKIIDSTSGWFKESNYSDVNSLHIYFKKIKINKHSSKPIIVSEFGGYVYKCKGHIFNENKDYGYKTFNNSKDYHDGIYKLYHADIIGNIKNNLAGAIYTQVSDVEDEINGLLTYDREVLKVDRKMMLVIKEHLDKEFYND